MHRDGKITASNSITFLLLTVFHKVSEVLLVYLNFHYQIWLGLRTRISESCVVVCFLGKRRCNIAPATTTGCDLSNSVSEIRRPYTVGLRPETVRR